MVQETDALNSPTPQADPHHRLLGIALRLGRLAQEMTDGRVASALRQARGSTVDAVRTMARSGERDSL